MNYPYEEIVEGETILRIPPDERHELICDRLHEFLAAALLDNQVSRILPRRSIIQISTGTMVRPDLALITAASGKPWLVAEIINSHDHKADTVIKKTSYENCNIPRLWMVDARYDNVEIYQGGPYGLALKSILAGEDRVKESLLPKLSFSIRELFAKNPPPNR
ncbi:MAG: hypothetical protein JWN25_354 [Verrucomicrobiales bacterium]|nr:hypothetical protein [Verrucomicrobiales bacterium]